MPRRGTDKKLAFAPSARYSWLKLGTNDGSAVGKRCNMAESDEYYMRLALKEAQRAFAEDEVPVGAVLVAADGSVLAATHNTSEHGLHALAHAEAVAMSIGAVSLEQKRLWDCTLYVTLEPCTMCAAAVSMMRIRRLVYGAANPKGGAVENGVRFFQSPACNHRPEVMSGVLADECGGLLTAFFQNKRRDGTAGGADGQAAK